MLLHGSTSSSRTWWNVGPRLADAGWTVVAFDLPGHGGSLPPSRALVPTVAADALLAELRDTSIDVLAGHSFGAAVAVTLAAQDACPIGRLFLEELPGPQSVAWIREAESVAPGAAGAHHDCDAAIAQMRSDQPRWAARDCRYAVEDLATCHIESVAAGLRAGATWLSPPTMQRVSVPVHLLLAPDAPGGNGLQDASALRGPDRTRAATDLRANVTVVDGGHCLHRDRPDRWLSLFAETTTSAL